MRLDPSSVTVSVVAHLHALRSGDPKAEITRRLQLELDGKPFQPRNIQLMRDPANGIVMWQAQRDGAAKSVTVAAPLFPEGTGLTTVVSVFKDGQVLDESVVDAEHPTVTLGEQRPVSGRLTVLAQFVREGMAHIFLGPDHVLFLLSLLLLRGNWKQLLKITTAFTLAHSVTLSLAATGIVTLAPRLVEPVIALSIVAVAAANLWHSRSNAAGAPLDTRPWLALGFGLIHGFGFAGALNEVGLPRESLGWALAGFNVGVELGQAAIILAVAPVLAWLAASWPRAQRPLVVYGSLAVAVVGGFWFTQRLFMA